MMHALDIAISLLLPLLTGATIAITSPARVPLKDEQPPPPLRLRPARLLLFALPLLWQPVAHGGNGLGIRLVSVFFVLAAGMLIGMVIRAVLTLAVRLRRR
ncbi:hypothetical protein ACIPJN_29890 [Streptomyces sp. NPDC086796]|uniref:hypothetical protein n=1 Tax=Streptomyces sp. NPDC086796 TaxID=3365760 RepID=UPI0038176072